MINDAKDLQSGSPLSPLKKAVICCCFKDLKIGAASVNFALHVVSQI